MKIEYIRNPQSGYMRIELPNPLSRTEEEMLSNNVIEGLLPVCRQQENGKYLLRYDITGKQALDSILENAPADERLLRSLLIGISVVWKQLEKYLLSAEEILLTPETVFWEGKTEKVYFCYCPKTTESFREQLVRLMEYMLAKTDHKNIAAVQMVYSVYEEVRQDTFYVGVLQDYLQEVSVRKLEIEEKMPESRIIETDNNTKQPNRKEQVMAWIKERIKRLSKKKMVNRKELFADEEAVMQESATTIMKVDDNELKGILKYRGTNFLTDIRVTKTPFIIGSASNCDAVIKHPNISRKHAKITVCDDIYFIEDLNSTNGTKVNGGLLSYKTKVSLSKNESVYLANEPFYFV